MNTFLRALGCAMMLFGLPACAGSTPEIEGTWEGRLGASQLLFKFRANGEANLSITVDREMSSTYCRWTRVGRRISVTNSRGQVRWFAIVDWTRDSLTLRLDAGAAGLCRFQRVRET